VTGTVKNLVQDRGFGFIVGEDGTEYFFHRSEVTGGEFPTLQRGDPVRFDVAAISPKGPRAEAVARVRR
jgi:cold shock protein